MKQKQKQINLHRINEQFYISNNDAKVILISRLKKTILMD